MGEGRAAAAPPFISGLPTLSEAKQKNNNQRTAGVAALLAAYLYLSAAEPLRALKCLWLQVEPAAFIAPALINSSQRKQGCDRSLN